jgi:hypothetical protein
MSIPESQLSSKERQRRFVQTVNGFPLPAQEVIADFSSMMIEPDVAARVRRSHIEILGFTGYLKSAGLQQEQVVFVLNYFELPDPTIQRRK